MQKWKIVGIVLVLCAVTRVSAQKGAYNERARQYIEQYKQWAMEEQRRSGVPAAITLAQGIHETSAGNSELALNANNHFGIKCKKEWKGATYSYTDDAPDECFRKYDHPLQSYKDHSDYLAGSARYAALFKLQNTDYKGWCTGLKRCGYATNPKYAQILMKIVEDYNLQDYTFAALSPDFNPVKTAEQAAAAKAVATAGEVIPVQDAAIQVVPDQPVATPGKKSTIQVSYGAHDEPVKKKINDDESYTEDLAAPSSNELVTINGLKAFHAAKGSVLLNDAFKYNIRYSKLLELNDLPDFPLEADMYIYIEKKSTKGANKTHIVKTGETLLQIAQAEGMQLKYLKYYNHIAANEEVEAGELLQLQEYSESKPVTYIKSLAPADEPQPAFSGSKPSAVPQGATRMRAGYISKKEISGTQSAATRSVQKREAPAAAITRSEEISVAKENTVPAVTEEKDMPESASAFETGNVAPAPAPQPEQPKSKIEPVEESLAAIPHDPEEKILESTASASIPEATPEVTEPAAQPVASVDAPVRSEEIDYNTKPEVTETAVASISEAPAVTPPAVPVPAVAEPVAATPSSEPVVAPADTKDAETKPVPQEIVNIADEVAVEEEKKAAAAKPAVPEEPQDEFSRLKAKLDRVVYSSENKAAKQPETKEAKGSAKPEAAPASKTAANTASTYTVKKGDTAFSIAKKHNITMRQLMDWNKLDFESIKVGQQLRVKQP